MLQSRSIILANWKMHFLEADALKFIQDLRPHIPQLNNCECWISPQSTILAPVARALKGSAVHVGSQNVHWAEKGAFTGELSVSMLKDVGASFAIVGHSERRNIMAESIDQVAARAKFALASGLSVVFCVGETATERQFNKTESVLSDQLIPLFVDLKLAPGAELLIAYEPVWAIGSGKIPNLEEIASAHDFINSLAPAGLDLRILYGGSVTPENSPAILALPQVKGAIIGGASLDVQKLVAILKAI